MNKYERRGVSADKKDVHEAIKNLEKGLFPNAFCKVLPDFLTNDDDSAVLMHADTAGTKTSLAYIYWKETGDISVWEGIAQDAIVMNLDDLACTGAINNIYISSTIGRNKHLISADVIKTIINANNKFCNHLRKFGINVHLSGGETADVGDIVRTIDVGITAFTSIQREKAIKIDIQEGDVIVGLASDGKSTYEDNFTSGIGSNGLTFARHEVLNKSYIQKYPESYDPNIEADVIYSGNENLLNASSVEEMNIGKLLLSPTRTYLPVIKKLVETNFKDLHGIIHCTGGGQTKILHFIENMHIVKDNLFDVPAVFRLIQQQSKADWREMYQVFNMGHRLEVYVRPQFASNIINISHDFGIEAKSIG